MFSIAKCVPRVVEKYFYSYSISAILLKYRTYKYGVCFIHLIIDSKESFSVVFYVTLVLRNHSERKIIINGVLFITREC